MSKLDTKDPFSPWGYGERPRCDFCGQYKSLPGSRVSPAHKKDCKWAKKNRQRRETAARRLLGITKAEVEDIKRRRQSA